MSNLGKVYISTYLYLFWHKHVENTIFKRLLAANTSYLNKDKNINKKYYRRFPAKNSNIFQLNRICQCQNILSQKWYKQAKNACFVELRASAASTIP